MPINNKKIIVNKQKGSRKGSKWPQTLRTAALAEMLIEPNLHRIAKKYGVPESTLRNWYKTEIKKGEVGRNDIFMQARKDVAQRIAQVAYSGVELSTKMMQERVIEGVKSMQKKAEIQKQLQSGEICEEKKEVLREELEYLPVVEDYPLANFARTLNNIANKAANMGVENTPQEVNVILSGEAVDLAK